MSGASNAAAAGGMYSERKIFPLAKLRKIFTLELTLL
jgi:hypothetical protein